MEEIDTFTGTYGFAAYHHAMTMVTKLPRAIHGNSIQGFIQIACIESWYTNMRLLCEFYDIAGGGKGWDYKAKEFAEVNVSSESREELNKVWRIASKFVSHLSKERNPNKNSLNVDFSLPNMLRLARLILEVSEDFEISLKNIGSKYSTYIHMTNVSARTELDFGVTGKSDYIP